MTEAALKDGYRRNRRYYRGGSSAPARLFGAVRGGLFGLLLAIPSGQVAAQQQDRLMLIAAELPPYAYRSAGQVTGLGVEILQEIGRRLQHSGAISLMPFRRAFQNARSRNDLLMTPVARVASREGQLKWLIHYVDDSFFYVTRAGDRKLTHASARQGGSIGVLAGSAPLAQLQQGGISDYLEQTRDTANIEMLRIGRIDGWFTSAILLSAAFKSNPELNQADFVIGDVQSRHCVYIVASNGTSDALLRPWQQTFAAMQADGTVANIIDRYLNRDLQALLDDGGKPVSTCAYPSRSTLAQPASDKNST